MFNKSLRNKRLRIATIDLRIQWTIIEVYRIDSLTTWQNKVLCSGILEKVSGFQK